MKKLKSGINKVSFKSLGLNLAGNLYTPENFDESSIYPSIIVTPPAHQIKEQTPAVYGPLLAKLGYVFLAFDYNSKGESESYAEEVRNDEHNFRKQEDLRNAISWLGSQNFVNKEKLFGIGICGGGNVMSGVVITDLRIKAFATISAMLATDMLMFANKEAFRVMITGANEVRQRMYETRKPENIDLFGYDDPNFLEKAKKQSLSGAMVDGYYYYGTDRAGTAKYPNFSNKVLANINESVSVNLGEQYADKILQPFLGVVGEKAETAPYTKIFFDKITSEKEYFVVPEASHVDLYDQVEYCQIAVNKIDEFFKEHSQ